MKFHSVYLSKLWVHNWCSAIPSQLTVKENFVCGRYTKVIRNKVTHIINSFRCLRLHLVVGSYYFLGDLISSEGRSSVSTVAWVTMKWKMFQELLYVPVIMDFFLQVKSRLHNVCVWSVMSNEGKRYDKTGEKVHMLHSICNARVHKWSVSELKEKLDIKTPKRGDYTGIDMYMNKSWVKKCQVIQVEGSCRRKLWR